MQILQYLLETITGGNGDKLTSAKVTNLVSSKDHSPVLSRRRATVILSRIRLMALFGSALYFSGILFDVFSLEEENFKSLVVYRCVAAGLMLVLVLAIRKSESLNAAYRGIAFFFAINLIFQALSQPLILPQYLQSIIDLPTAGYAVLPFLIVVCIAIFPLTIKETFLLVVLFFTAEMLILTLMPDQSNPQPGLGILTSLTVACALCSFSAISQLSYMVSLVDQASIDVLTDCYSRNSGEEILDVQFRIARRQKTPMVIAFLDLDDFKQVNDKYGHEAGDTVLATAANYIRRNLRESDILIRWGGEEFVMLLPHTDTVGATKAIRRMRANGLGMRPDGNPVTASIGVVELISSQASSWMELIELADTQMYMAKAKGKNDFCIHQPSDNTSVA